LLKINHIGYVVANIENFASSFPVISKIRQIYDPLQHADLALYEAGSSTFIELVTPLDKTSFTWNYLSRFGDGLHHICYEGIDEPAVESLISSKRMLKIRGPIYAPLFGKNVIFAITRSRAIVEFLLP
jgi:hypothetical protein